MVRDALVVGINSYQAEVLKNLQAPAEDAEAIAVILEQHGEFNVQRLPEAIDKETQLRSCTSSDKNQNLARATRE